MYPININSSNIYQILSGIKCALGLGILIITYNTINVYEDPGIAIGLSFLGIFILARGASFFLFRFLQKQYNKELDHIIMLKESYKLSLLFGIYSIINYLLILLGWRNKYFGIILLGLFIWLEFSLFTESSKSYDKHK